MNRWIYFCLLVFVAFPLSLSAQPADSAKVYQGMTIKIDPGATALALAVTGARVQHYEVGMNWRLINRLYPTFEAGYAGTLPATKTNPTRGEIAQGDSVFYRGQGGFFRVGLDINPLKKSAATSLHALLVGVRIGTSIQHMRQENIHTAAMPWYGVRADCWGEVVAGCQVDVYRGLTMGWMARMRFLFTRANAIDRIDLIQYPIYIPGFGHRDDMAWGLSYYIGYRF